MQKSTFPEDRWAISVPTLSGSAIAWIDRATNYGLAVAWLVEDAARQGLPYPVAERMKGVPKSLNRWTISIVGLSFAAEKWLRNSPNYGDTVLALIESAAAENKTFPKAVIERKNVRAEILEAINSGMARKEVAKKLSVTYAYVCMVIKEQKEKSNA